MPKQLKKPKVDVTIWQLIVASKRTDIS